MVCIKVSSSFLKSLDVVQIHKAINFSSDFINLLLNDTIIITNSCSESDSPWKMTLWIFTFGKVHLPTINSIFLFFHGCHDVVYDFVGYFEHFQTFYYPSLQNHLIRPFVVNPCHGYIFPLRFYLLEDVLIYV